MNILDFQPFISYIEGYQQFKKHMKHFISVITLFIFCQQTVLADTINTEKNNQSITAIILGAIVLTGIILILVRKQKRRFND